MRLYAFVRDCFGRVARVVYRLEVVGRERIPSTGGCIIVANHESSLDPLVLAQATSRQIRFLARSELWRPPLLRQFFDAVGAIPVRRGCGDLAALQAAATQLRRGEIVAIFPQGTVLPFRPRQFQRGAARLALTTGAPIIPVTLVGTGRAFSLLPPRLGLPKLQVLVGEPRTVPRCRPYPRRTRALTESLERSVRAPRGARFSPRTVARDRSDPATVPYALRIVWQSLCRKASGGEPAGRRRSYRASGSSATRAAVTIAPGERSYAS